MASPELYSLEEYVAHLTGLHPQMPPVRQLTGMLCSLRSPRTNARTQLPLQCKICQATPSKTCPVVLHQLPVLNEWLYELGSEIREVAPGRLAVLSLENYRAQSTGVNQVIAMVFVHCLLTRHRCLQGAEGLRHLLPSYRKMFCDAIRNSSSLTSLKLSKCELNGLTIRSLMAAVTSTDRLEELSLDSCNLPGPLQAAENALVSYIGKTKSLRSLSLIDVPFFRDDRVLGEALEKNKSIVKLTVGSQVLLPEQEEAFCRFLSCNTRIVELGLVGSVYDGAVKLDKAFMAITENSTLQKLSVRMFNLDLIAASCCFEALARSPVLQEVEFPDCTWKPVGGHEVPARQQAVRALAAKLGQELRVGPLVAALEKTTSLRKLTLCVGLSDWEMRKILDAVRSCASLETIIFDNITTTSAEAFYRALVETGAIEKVAFNSLQMTSSDFMSCLQRCGNMMRSGNYNFTASNLAALREVAANLHLHDRVTALKLCLEGVQDISLEDALTIAAYLSSTTTLKDIYFSFGVPRPCAHTLIEGITNNSTLEKLGIEGWYVYDDDIEVLCKWLAASKKMYHLVYLCEHYPSCEALVVGLKEVLVDSYTLTYLKVREFTPTFSCVQASKNLVRRNLSLVECAVQFVLGSTHKRAAEAFETVSYHPQVAYKVAEAASLSPADVQEKLKKSWRRLRAHFWQLSGIVQEELVCNYRRDGKMQIDELGHDALLHLCSFLRVSYVLDEARKKRVARKRKRRGW